MAEPNIKKLTRENWLEPESMMPAFVCLSLKDGTVSPISANEWASRFLQPQLIKAVPAEITTLFEVARGSIAYGYFFYPLFTLAGEQLFRVADAAAGAKCEMLGAPKSIKQFAKRLAYLFDHGVLTQAEREHWDTIRFLRNHVSHPAQQTILAPGNILFLLVDVSNRINSLFA